MINLDRFQKEVKPDGTAEQDESVVKPISIVGNEVVNTTITEEGEKELLSPVKADWFKQQPMTPTTKRSEILPSPTASSSKKKCLSPEDLNT